jgi:hypothetical protein
VLRGSVRRSKTSRVASDRPFAAADQDWVIVRDARFFFEPWCTDFEPDKPGQLVVLLGDDVTRHRGVDVSVEEGGLTVVWVPQGGRSFWLPDLVEGQSADEPWELRLREFDHESGTRVVVWGRACPVATVAFGSRYVARLTWHR